MTIATGTVAYSLGNALVTGQGLNFSEAELDTALAGSVAETLFDDTGTASIRALLSGLSETDFDSAVLERLLSPTQKPEDWRVGEAFAETYLVQHRRCFFPWPDGRDERKSGSSLPGADLVGFHREGKVERFAFGEVKTSNEAVYPPSAAYGETGFKQQLEDLRDKPDIRNDLVKYLAHRATQAPWKKRFQNAYIRYAKDSQDVRIFGLLVRDVPPDQKDLQARVKKLGTGCPIHTAIELLALYLPLDTISTLGNKVMQFRTEAQA